MSQHVVTAAKAELGALLDDARWGSGFDGTRTKRVWAPLAATRCLDQAALAPVVLDAVEQAIGPGAQFGNTCAIQVHPGQQAQVLHYEQGIYPLPRDRDVMVTALWGARRLHRRQRRHPFQQRDGFPPVGSPGAPERRERVVAVSRETWT